MKKVKRVLSLILVLVMLAGMLAACGTPANNTPSNVPENGNAAEVKYKEDITIIMDGSLPSLNRFQTGVETNACQRLNWCLFDRLLYEDDNGDFKASLATDWSTEDGLV